MTEIALLLCKEMIALLDTSEDLDVCENELGCPVEQLLTPLTRFTPQRPEAKFAIDNGAFSKFDPKQFESLLAREYPRRHLCRFVAVPDVVGSARRTIEVFDHWYERISQWPLAMVAQDGQENLPIPWKYLEAIFIGGTTKWKLSQHATDIIKAAKAMGKWVHVGRVNEPCRFENFEKQGADSFDGTGLARYTHMRERIYRAEREPTLFQAARNA